ncbi:MAG: tetratricopeptide repeat protein [Elusimicrobiota bacterium]
MNKKTEKFQGKIRRIFKCLLISLFFLIYPAEGKALDKVEDRYSEGERLMRAGNYDAARSAFREVLNQSGENSKLRASSWNNLGAMALTEGKIDEAERALRNALKINPEKVNALNNLAGLRLRQGLYKDAVNIYRSAIKIDPRYIEATNNLANLLIEIQQYSRAGDLLASAIDMDIANERSLKLLARMYAENNVDKDAEKVRKEWLRKVGTDPARRADVGFQYLAFDQPKQAREVLQTIRKDNPGWNGLEVLEGRIHAAEGNWGKAKKKLKTGLEKNPSDSTVRNDLVTVLLRGKDIEEALKVAEEGTQKAPDQAVSWFLKGLVYEEKGESKTAESSYEKTLEINPGHTDALVNLAVIKAGQEEIDRAIELLEKALSDDPHNQEVLYNLGRVLVVSRREYKRGIRLLQYASRGKGESAQRAVEFINRLYEGIKNQ